MREMGIDPKKAIWEDLGGKSQLFIDVFEKQFKLPGMYGIKWTQSSGVNRAGTAYVASCDDKPGRQIISSGEYKN